MSPAARTFGGWTKKTGGSRGEGKDKDPAIAGVEPGVASCLVWAPLPWPTASGFARSLWSHVNEE